MKKVRVMQITSPGQAVLFKLCRTALKMTLTDFQIFLCLKDRHFVYRMEIGEVPISGPVWVSIRSRLEEEGQDDLVARVDGIIRDRRYEVEEINQQMRQRQARGRQEREITAEGEEK